jgi:acetyl esterase/lipase
MKHLLVLVHLLFTVYVSAVSAQVTQRVVDIPTRPGVTQRIVLLSPDKPTSAVILFAGGHGGLRITANGSFNWGEGNFLVRTRDRFAAQGLLVAVVDAPSDRQNPPYLSGFRQTPEHVADIKAVIAWLKQQAKVPVWLVGTSRGTQSAAFAATQLPVADGGPDGLVLTSTMLSDNKGRPCSRHGSE